MIKSKILGWGSKLLCTGFALLLLCAMGAQPVFASSTMPEQEATLEKVYDYAGAFSEEEAATLNQQAQALVQELSMDFVVLTTTDRNGYSPTDYTRRFYVENDIGVGENNNGILLMIDTLDRKVEVAAYTLDGNYLSDADTNLLLDAFVDGVGSTGGTDYYAGAAAFLVAAGDLVRERGLLEQAPGIPEGTVISTDVKVHDFASLFNENEKDTLTQKIAGYTADTGADFVIVTVNGTGGKTMQDFADDFYWDNGFGIDSKRSGVLLLILPAGNNKWSVHFSDTGRVVDYVSDYEVQSIVDSVLTSLAEDGPYSASDWFLTLVYNQIEGQMRAPGFRVSTELISIAAVVGIGLSAAIVGIMFWRHKGSLPKAPPAQTYMPQGIQLARREDRFVSTFTSRRALPKDTGSSGGFGGGSTHSSSGGGSFGGGGGSSGGGFSGGGRSF